MSYLKLKLKSHLVRWLPKIGRSLTSAAQRRMLCDRLVPFLMDDRVLPRELITVKLRSIPVSVPVDPYVYVHRSTLWCGVFFEEEVENFLMRQVHAGDTVIDVGMNVGHVALPAAYLVGESGSVHAFEPQPDLVAMVRELAALQKFPQLQFHECALGEQEGEMNLRFDSAHLGGATLRSSNLAPRQINVRSVPVRRGDTVLKSHKLSGRVFLKVDAEGFELDVISGMPETLQRVDAAIVEISPQWLSQRDMDTLFSYFDHAGLKPHALELDGSIGAPVASAQVKSQANILFARSWQ